MENTKTKWFIRVELSNSVQLFIFDDKNSFDHHLKLHYIKGVLPKWITYWKRITYGE